MSNLNSFFESLERTNTTTKIKDDLKAGDKVRITAHCNHYNQIGTLIILSPPLYLIRVKHPNFKNRFIKLFFRRTKFKKIRSVNYND